MSMDKSSVTQMTLLSIEITSSEIFALITSAVSSVVSQRLVDRANGQYFPNIFKNGIASSTFRVYCFHLLFNDRFHRPADPLNFFFDRDFHIEQAYI